MSKITFTCNSCNQLLKVDADKAGRKVKCVKCGAILTIPGSSKQERDSASNTPAPNASPPLAKRRNRQEEDRPSSPRQDEKNDEADDGHQGGGRKDSWSKIRLGSLMVLIGLCIFSGGYALHVLAVLFLTMNSGIPSGGAARTIENFSGFSILLREAGLIGVVVGFVFWLFVTKTHGKLAFAITTLAVGVLFLIFQVLPLIDDRVPIAVLILIAFLLPAMILMIFLFTRGVGKTLEDESLASRSFLGVIVAGVAAAYLVIVPVVLRLMKQSSFESFPLILTWLGIAMSVFVQIFAIIIVKATHSAADR